jgi:hypothetical protein
MSEESLERYRCNLWFYKHWKYIYTDDKCDVTCALDEIMYQEIA